jgi:hypothetical protein
MNCGSVHRGLSEFGNLRICIPVANNRFCAKIPAHLIPTPPGTFASPRPFPVMGRDFSVFAQPGFWISLALLGLLFAAAVAVIADSSNYPVPSQLA